MARREAKLALAGQPISEQARQRLSDLMRVPLAAIPTHIVPKGSSQQGQWICADCGEPFRNNFEAQFHGEEKPAHRLAWRGPTGDLEEP